MPRALKIKPGDHWRLRNGDVVIVIRRVRLSSVPACNAKGCPTGSAANELWQSRFNGSQSFIAHQLNGRYAPICDSGNEPHKLDMIKREKTSKAKK